MRREKNRRKIGEDRRGEEGRGKKQVEQRRNQACSDRVARNI